MVVRLTLNRDALGPLSNYCQNTPATSPILGEGDHFLVRAMGGGHPSQCYFLGCRASLRRSRSSSACRLLWPPRAAQGRPSARNPTRVGCSHLLPLCSLLYEHYSSEIRADCEELLLPPSIAFTTDKRFRPLLPIASRRIRRGHPTPDIVLSRVVALSAVVTGVRHLSQISAGIPRILHVLWALASSGRITEALRGPFKPPNLRGPI